MLVGEGGTRTPFFEEDKDKKDLVQFIDLSRPLSGDTKTYNNPGA